MNAQRKRLLTEAEYLMIERAAEFKSEYVDGEIYAMAGAGLRHGFIVANISGRLLTQFMGRECRVVTNDLRVAVENARFYTYPDVVAFCGKPRLLDAHQDTLLNPRLIAEVLSPGTAEYDRGEELRRFRKITSLTDYLIVAQDRMWVEHWSRQTDNSWSVKEYTGPSDVIVIKSVAAELVLRDVYERVEFPDEPR